MLLNNRLYSNVGGSITDTTSRCSHSNNEHLNNPGKNTGLPNNLQNLAPPQLFAEYLQHVRHRPGHLQTSVYFAITHKLLRTMYQRMGSLNLRKIHSEKWNRLVLGLFLFNTLELIWKTELTAFSGFATEKTIRRR